MISQEKISIIIPIFNSEKYLDRCITSIINQVYRNIEIILVDDGSTDNSKNICMKYKNMDNRVVLISQKNSGVSHSRNVGMKKAEGEYILFIDADDYIEENYISELSYNLIEDESDVIISAYTENSFKGAQKRDLKNFENCGYKCKIEKEKLMEMCYTTFEFNPCWKQLYKKSIIDKFNIQFENNISFGEDFLFNLAYFKNCNSFTYIKNYGYNYCINNYSASNNFSIESIEKKYNDNLYIAKKVISLSDTTIKNSALQKCISIFIACTCLLCKSKEKYFDFKKIYVKYRKAYDRILKEYKMTDNSFIFNLQLFLLKNNLVIFFYNFRKIIEWRKRK